MFNSCKKKIKEEIIGEVYAGWFYGMATSGICSLNTIAGPGQMVDKGFYKITASDIKDKVDNKVKIGDIWFNRDQMFLYNDNYNGLRNEILNKYGKSKSKEN